MEHFRKYIFPYSKRLVIQDCCLFHIWTLVYVRGAYQFISKQIIFQVSPILEQLRSNMGKCQKHPQEGSLISGLIEGPLFYQPPYVHFIWMASTLLPMKVYIWPKPTLAISWPVSQYKLNSFSHHYFLVCTETCSQ